MAWWVRGMVREGFAHLCIAAAIYGLLVLLMPSDQAAVGAVVFFWGREIRDFEIEALPGIMRALGFKDWNGLRPAVSWDLRTLRHSLAGWVPVTVLGVFVYVLV